MRYALAHPAVATVVPGASSAGQLGENAGAAGVTLGEAELTALRALSTGTVYTQHR